jgi:spore maturation protein CgeB
MTTRIETKDHERMESTLIPSARARLKDNPILRPLELDEIPALIPDDKGGQTPTQASDRTAPPLKMVLFAQPGCASSEKEASAYLALTKALSARGHRLLVLEHQQNRKKKKEPPLRDHSILYSSIKELKDRFTPEIRNADFVMISSDVSDGAAIGEWVTHMAQGTTAFYDLDTPATLAKLDRGENGHLSRALLSRYHLYLSFTGGPLLELVKRYYGSPMVRPLYGSVDTAMYYPQKVKLKWDLGYAGDFSDEKVPGLDELLLEPARHWDRGQFLVAGQGFSQMTDWPENAKRSAHPAAGSERAFYNAQRFTLNVTGADMIDAGFAPSMRIFEAAACGTPIISDYWEGLESFFEADEEILFARSAEEVLDYLRGIGENERLRIGDNARRKVLGEHSAGHRAFELESYAMQAMARV